MSIIYVYFNHINNRRLVRISRKKILISEFDGVSTVGDFLRVLDRNHLGDLGVAKTLLLYHPTDSAKKIKTANPLNSMDRLQPFGQFYVAVFEMYNQEDYFSDVALLKNNLLSRGHEPSATPKELKKTPAALVGAMNYILQGNAQFLLYLNGEAKSPKSFNFPVKNFEKLFDVFQKEDYTVSGTVPEQLLGKFFRYWVDKLSAFLATLHLIRKQIGFFGGNFGGPTTFFAWDTERIPLNDQELLNDQKSLAQLFLRLDISNGFPQSMAELKGKIDATVESYAWLSSLITAAENLFVSFCKQFAVGDINRNGTLLFSLHSLKVVNYQRDESPYSHEQNFEKNSQGLFTTLAQYIVAMDVGVAHLKKWLEIILNNPVVREQKLAALLFNGYHAMGRIVSKNKVEEPEFKLISTHQARKMEYPSGASNLLTRLEPYIYYLKFSPADAFFQWNINSNGSNAKDDQTLGNFQKFLRLLLNAPSTALSVAPISRIFESESQIRKWNPVVSHDVFMTRGLIGASDEDSIVQVLAHWFRSAPHPTYARLFKIWFEKNPTYQGNPDGKGVERIVLKMLLKQTTMDNLLTFIFGPSMQDQHTQLTLETIMKGYSAVRMMESIQADIEELASVIPGNILEHWMMPFLNEALTFFEKNKYTKVVHVVESAKFVAEVIAIVIQLSALIDELTTAIDWLIKERNLVQFKETIKGIMTKQDLVRFHVNQINVNTFNYAKLFKLWANKKLFQIRSALFHFYHLNEAANKKIKFFKKFFSIQEMFPEKLYSDHQAELNQVLTNYFLIQKQFTKKFKTLFNTATVADDENDDIQESTSSFASSSSPPSPSYLVKSM